MKLYNFSGDWKYRDGEKCLCNYLWWNFYNLWRGNENFNGKAKEARRGKCYDSKLAGKQIFVAGHPFTLAGQRFSGVVTGGKKHWYIYDGFPISCLWPRCIKLKTGLTLHLCRKSSVNMQLTTIHVTITTLCNLEWNLLATGQKASDLKVRSCGKCYHQRYEIQNRFFSLKHR